MQKEERRIDGNIVNATLFVCDKSRSFVLYTTSNSAKITTSIDCADTNKGVNCSGEECHISK